MRAGFGLVGLLICIGVIVWIMHKSTLPYTQEVLNKSDKAREQVNQIVGNSRDGQMRFSDSLVIETQTKAGKIDSILVTTVKPGGPAETFFGLMEGDAITDIGPLEVKAQVQSDDDAKAYLQSEYSRSGTIKIVRDGNKLTLPVNKPKPGPAAVGSKATDEIQQQMNVHTMPGMP